MLCAMQSLKAFWTAVALALAQCCATDSYGQRWFPGSPTTRRGDALLAPLNRATSAASCTLKQRRAGPEANSFSTAMWRSSAVCEQDLLAHTYAVHLGSTVTWYVLLSILVVPGAVAVAEQVLHSLWLTWVAFVDVVKNLLYKKFYHEVASDPAPYIKELMVPLLKTQWRHVRNAWWVGLRPAHGLDIQLSRLLYAWFHFVMAYQWFMESPPEHRNWFETFIDIWIPALLCVAPILQPERPYARALAASAVLQLHITPHHKLKVFAAFQTAVMSMPSVLSYSTVYYIVYIVIYSVIFMVAFMGLMLLVCYLIGKELLGMLRISCRFMSSGNNMWWLCWTTVKYVGLAVYWTVIAVAAGGWLVCCAVYLTGKKFAIWIALCMNGAFVFLGATEIVAAAWISKHWSRIKPHLHMQYKQVRRIYRRTAGDPAAFATQTAHWLVTGNIGTTNHSTGGQSTSDASKRQQQQQSRGPTSWRFWRSSSTGSATPTAASNSTAAQAFSCTVGSEPSDPAAAVPAAAVPAATEENDELDLSDLLQWVHRKDRKDSSKTRPTTTSTGSIRPAQLSTHTVSEATRQHCSGDLAVPVPARACVALAPVVPKPTTPKSKAKAATSAEEAKQQSAKDGSAGSKRPSKKQSTGLIQPPARLASAVQTHKAVDSVSKHAAAGPAQTAAISKQGPSGKAAAQPAKAAIPKQINVLEAVVSCNGNHSMRSSKLADVHVPCSAAAEVVTLVLNPATVAADWPELQPIRTVAAAIKKQKKGGRKAALASAKSATATRQSNASRSPSTMDTAAAAHIAAAVQDATPTDSSPCGVDRSTPSIKTAMSSVPASAAASPRDACGSDREKQQQYSVDGVSSVDSMQCQTPSLSPQISGPYRPLMFSNSGSYSPLGISIVDSAAVGAAGEVISQNLMGTAAATVEDGLWSIPSAMADALGWPAADVPAAWTATWPAAPAASTSVDLMPGALCALEHDSLAAATATAAANAVLEDSDDSSCVLCKLMPRSHACVHCDDEVCLCLCAACGEEYDYVGRGCPLCQQSVDCMLVLK